MTITKMIAASAALGLVGTSVAAAAQTNPGPAAAPAATTTGAPPATSPAPANQPGATLGATAATMGATANIAQGGTVYDPQGGTVGSIESVSGDFVVLATTKSKVRLPRSSFAAGPKGPMIAMTAGQLDQAAAQAVTAAAAASSSTKVSVTKGAAVVDTAGGAVGTVSEVDTQFATVALTTGSKVRLPIAAFGPGSTNASLRVAMTAAQLSAAAAASGGATGG